MPPSQDNAGQVNSPRLPIYGAWRRRRKGSSGPAPASSALIAHFAEAIRPEPCPVASEQAQDLAELVTRQRQVVEMIGLEGNRRRTARSPKVLRGIERTLAALQATRSPNSTGRSMTSFAARLARH